MEVMLSLVSRLFRTRLNLHFDTSLYYSPLKCDQNCFLQWSYGVTCWEIFSAGKVPYPGIVPANLPKLVAQGLHLEKPANDACSDDV